MSFQCFLASIISGENSAACHIIVSQYVVCLFSLATFFFSFIFISWRLITLQYCSGFCHTLTWISHGVTCIPRPDPPLPPPSPPDPSGSSQCTRSKHLSHASNLGWWSVSPSADEWIRKLWYIYTMECYSAIKKNSFESVLMRWMKLEPIIRSEVSQKGKHQYSILTHICGISRYFQGFVFVSEQFGCDGCDSL